MRAKIDKLVFGGQAMGTISEANDPKQIGKLAFVWGALPGETVELDVVKNKKNLLEGNASAIITSSSSRTEPTEKHFLSCSPWQIMSFQEENDWKVRIAEETYEKIGGLKDLSLDIAADADAQYGYRNKIEYSFAEESPSLVKGGTGRVPGVSLAFFTRGGRVHQPIPQCELATPAINTTSLEILAWINEQKIPLRSLKAMIVRSNQKGETIAALFIKDRLPFTTFPKLHDGFVGFQLYYSTHKSPASVPTDLLYTAGQQFLTETINNVTFKYGLLSFFQVNIPLFTQALRDISEHIPHSDTLLDYYSGVGAIGLSLAHTHKKVVLLEINEEAVGYAEENIAFNKIKNAEAILSPAEHITDIITSESTVLLDPPREGLHPDMISRLKTALPPRIAYLSCNLSTHARDISLLTDAYRITFLRLYNFFPRTPHIEALAILERK